MAERRAVSEFQVRVAKRVLQKRGWDITEEQGCFNLAFYQSKSLRLHQVSGESGLIELALHVLRAERVSGMHFQKYN